MEKKVENKASENPNVEASQESKPIKKVRGNPSKLQPIRNKRKASELGKIGGKASGVARRKKADLQKTVLAAMTAAVKDPKLIAFADKLGVKGNTNLEMLVGVALGKALQGDAKHSENLVKWGGLFTEKIETENTHLVKSAFEEVDVAELGETLLKCGKK